jgi:tetratricopeptide (TPR) repeat protein
MNRSVSSSGNIEHSVIITGDGNSVALNFGGAFALPLERRQIASPRPRSQSGGYNPLPLLAPDAGELPLVGREAKLAELRDWLEAPMDVSVRALVAPAGTGKTRLALELCKLIDGAEKPAQQGWVAGFVRPADVASVVDRLAVQSLEWQSSTLLIVDYAAAVYRELARWLDRLASARFEGKLRLLLLDREAPEEFGWWYELTHPTENRAVTRRDLFVDPQSAERLSDIAPGEERRALLTSALVATSRLVAQNRQAHSLPPLGEDAAFDAALATSRFGNPLNLAMAGLIAAEQGPAAAMALHRLDAARHLARHEVGRMVRIAEGERIDPSAMRHALAFNGLAGGLPLETLSNELTQELDCMGLPSASARLAEVLMQELPSPGALAPDHAAARLGTIQPDLIGEGVIVEALLVGSPERALRASEVVQRAYAKTGARAADALMRLIQDYGHALEDSHASPNDREVARTVLGLLLSLAEAIPDQQVERLETLVGAFPENTIVLREAAAVQTQRLVNAWAQIADNEDLPTELSFFARERTALWLNNLANRLSEIGQREAALNAAQDATQIFRELAEASPDAPLRDLASSLTTLGNRLGELGQFEASLAVTEEAADYFSKLATGGEDVRTDLAMTFNNMASQLAALGRREEALAAMQKAVEYYRALADENPTLGTPNLALALNNLGNRLSAVGRRENALYAVEESVRLRTELAAAYPDAFTSSLAMSLSNLAIHLGDQGKTGKAVRAAQDAVEVYRGLASSRPEAFISDLAIALGSLSGALQADGQFEAALAAASEAVDLFRALASARSDVFSSELSGMLNNYANVLAGLDRHEEALAAAQEAVALRRSLAASRPEAFNADLAMSLSVLGDRLEETGRLEEAIEADRQAVTILAPYARAEPAVFGEAMIVYLRDYLRRATAAGVEVDEKFVQSIMESLEPWLSEPRS